MHGRGAFGLFPIFLMVLLPAGLLAQQGGQTGSGTEASTTQPAATTTPPSVPTKPTYSDPQRAPDAMPILSAPGTGPRDVAGGRVLLPDGTPPPRPVAIERVCGGTARLETYTDSKGSFTLPSGHDYGGRMADASFGGDGGFGSPNNQHTTISSMGSNSGINAGKNVGCEIRASLAGYQSEVIPQGGAFGIGATIILRRAYAVEGTTVSITSLEAPKEARKAFDKGREALRKEKWADARKHLEKAVQLYPKFAAAWNELGTALLKSADRAGARAAFEKSLQSDPKFVNPYLELAVLATQQRRWKEVAGLTGEALRLDPLSYPKMYFLDAVAHLNLGKLDQAEKSAREGLNLDPHNRIPSLNQVLGVILANKGEHKQAARFMKAYLELAPNASDAAQARKQLAEVEKAAQSQPATAP